ncbi:zinc ABC transporter substrate-binding protein [Poseidonocella sp. HB161398]|uniref:zinc ABC transporter substrate-binding protein n=1 Tax=Poseidonocella sp. HB161398 TaxID=2320855 RepID=UPI0011080450|nr:zinc ABC transporter substrate-binding protein [Poseidonocella sp. HB161398]
MRTIQATIAAGFLLGGAGMAAAEVPHVATDIPPVHGLVARVMQGLGTPDLVVPPGASPHGYALRPSEAASLERADLVVWVGEALTPWLERPIGSLASGADVLELLAVPGTETLQFREGATFAPHSHGDGEAHDGDGHAGDEDHDHEHAGDEDHDHEHGHEEEHEEAGAHGDAHGHDHHGADPHAWLDPGNAALWLDAIAAELSELDPENAGAYAANAAAGRAEIDAAEAEAAALVTPLAGRPFIVFHDAYHYFEHHFGVEAAGALSLGDAVEPGPARVAEVRDLIRSMDTACVFAEPQFNPRLLETVTEGSGAKAAVLDPLGSDLPTGPGFYPALLKEISERMAGCLG